MLRIELESHSVKERCLVFATLVMFSAPHRVDMAGTGQCTLETFEILPNIGNISGVNQTVPSLISPALREF